MRPELKLFQSIEIEAFTPLYVKQSCKMRNSWKVPIRAAKLSKVKFLLSMLTSDSKKNGLFRHLLALHIIMKSENHTSIWSPLTVWVLDFKKSKGFVTESVWHNIVWYNSSWWPSDEDRDKNVLNLNKYTRFTSTRTLKSYQNSTL